MVRQKPLAFIYYYYYYYHHNGHQWISVPDVSTVCNAAPASVTPQNKAVLTHTAVITPRPATFFTVYLTRPAVPSHGSMISD